MSLKLIIGNYNYSSWSLRAWLFLQESGLPFETIRIPLFTDTSREDIAKYTPAGRLPVLLDDEVTVWDSLAIMRYARERFPDKAIRRPKSLMARAVARSIIAEMHSGFLSTREELPQNIRARYQLNSDHLSQATRDEIQRVITIWSECHEHYKGQGKWLFGELSIADIMYAPMALRFVTYGITLPPAAQHFVDNVLELESIKTWQMLSEQETETIDFVENLPVLSK